MLIKELIYLKVKIILKGIYGQAKETLLFTVDNDLEQGLTLIWIDESNAEKYNVFLPANTKLTMLGYLTQKWVLKSYNKKNIVAAFTLGEDLFKEPGAIVQVSSLDFVNAQTKSDPKNAIEKSKGELKLV